MSDRSPARNLGLGRLILFTLVLSLIGIIIYRNYFSGPGAYYTTIPKELQVNYVPAEFDLKMDEEELLSILSNPQQNRRAFNRMVQDINLSILNHVADRMGFTREQKSRIQSEYEKHHPYLRNMYYNDFMALKDTTSLEIQTWYESESTNSASYLQEVASKYTCYLVSHVITSIIPTEQGKILAKGADVNTPCGMAMSEALKPMMKRLEERAAVRDINRSKGVMQERVEKVLAQLITYEVSDKKAISKKLQTKIWGFTVSSSDVEISAVSLIKVGFDLSKFFEVNANSRSKTVSIKLPPPEIIAQEIYPRFEKMDIGWLREVKQIDLNKSIDLLRSEFRRTAMTPEVQMEAKKEAANLMKTMFIPVIKSLSKDYDLKIEFLENAPEPAIESDFFREQNKDK